MKKLPQAAWLLPPLICLAIYYPSIRTWFHQDDFAWLGLHLSIFSWRDLLTALFAPQAQGTIRPWSERLFFLTFHQLFGLHALPFHLWVFCTQVLNLTLLQWVTRRMTGSWVAGMLAPLFWVTNLGLATPLSWTSAYNQILCAGFLLGALVFLIRATETGRRRDWVAQWIVFVLGFGALEINIVYPAIAFTYCVLFARDHWKKTLPLFAVSAAYAVLHFTVAAKPKEGLYAQHWDLSIGKTLAIYAKMAPGAFDLDVLPLLPEAAWGGLAWLLAVAVAGWLVWAMRRRDWAPVFGAAWFVIVLAPILPLRDHIMDYYLAIPTIGLALILAWGLHRSWRWGAWPVRVAAVVVSVAYVGMTLPKTRTIVEWRYGLGRLALNLVLGVDDARTRYPGQMVLLTGITTDAFWFGVFDDPFRLLPGAAGPPPLRVLLAPGEEKRLDPHPELGDISPYLAPVGPALRAIRNEAAAVYHWTGSRLEDQTLAWRAKKVTPPPVSFVDAGLSLYADTLGEGWHPIESGFRWMGGRASVRLATPARSGAVLVLNGFCPEQQLLGGPLPLTLRIGSQIVGRHLLDTKGHFERRTVLPAKVSDKDEFTLILELGRTLKLPGEKRELGITFGKFEVLPASNQHVE